MIINTHALGLVVLLAATTFAASPALADSDSRSNDNRYDSDHKGSRDGDDDRRKPLTGAQLGPRPFYLVDGMDDSRLKDKLQSCKEGPFYRTDFSIGHRGAALQFPEHTREAYVSGARQGAGIVECDVTFTKDGELVCRHSECDLHTTTNIVNTDLNGWCTKPWNGQNSSPKCCTSDITLEQFKTLTVKMDASNPGRHDGRSVSGRHRELA